MFSSKRRSKLFCAKSVLVVHVKKNMKPLGKTNNRSQVGRRQTSKKHPQEKVLFFTQDISQLPYCLGKLHTFFKVKAWFHTCILYVVLHRYTYDT